jgi:sugar phosphate isomerase/epimerase
MRLGLDAGKDTHDLAVELGIRGVPISAQALVEQGVEATLAPLRARGLEVCQIGAFGYNPLLPDKEALAKQTALVEQAAELAADTGCPYIVINGGNHHPSGFLHGYAENFTDAALDEAAANLKPLCEKAGTAGACLSIEPYIKSAVSSPERFLALAEKVGSPALRVNLDVTNFFGLDEMWDCTETVRNACRSLAGHYGLVHVKDVVLREGFHIHVDLAPIDEGACDWTLMLKEAAPHVPDDSWVVLEHIASPEEARRCTAYLRHCAAEAGVTLE